MQQLNVAALTSITSSLRRLADQGEPSFSTRQIVDACFPGTTVTGRHLPPGVNEIVCVDAAASRTLRAPNVILYNRTISTGDQRLAIAHALGHIVLDGFREQRSLRRKEREERCDQFAEELLVPLDELRPYVCAWPNAEPELHERYLDQVDQIASQFNVSASVIDKRIRDLRLTRT